MKVWPTAKRHFDSDYNTFCQPSNEFHIRDNSTAKAKTQTIRLDFRGTMVLHFIAPNVLPCIAMIV